MGWGHGDGDGQVGSAHRGHQPGCWLLTAQLSPPSTPRLLAMLLTQRAASAHLIRLLPRRVALRSPLRCTHYVAPSHNPPCITHPPPPAAAAQDGVSNSLLLPPRNVHAHAASAHPFSPPIHQHCTHPPTSSGCCRAGSFQYTSVSSPYRATNWSRPRLSVSHHCRGRGSRAAEGSALVRCWEGCCTRPVCAAARQAGHSTSARRIIC